MVRHALLEDALTLALWWSSVRWVDQLTGTWWPREGESETENAKDERVGHSKRQEDKEMESRREKDHG